MRLLAELLWKFEVLVLPLRHLARDEGFIIHIVEAGFVPHLQVRLETDVGGASNGWLSVQTKNTSRTRSRTVSTKYASALTRRGIIDKGDRRRAPESESYSHQTETEFSKHINLLKFCVRRLN